MNTLREYEIGKRPAAPRRPPDSRPASRTRAALAIKSARSSPRAVSASAASSTFNVTPSRARRNTRRSAVDDAAFREGNAGFGSGVTSSGTFVQPSVTLRSSARTEKPTTRGFINGATLRKRPGSLG
ncbi:Uncharacterised protein [Mycobacteroides abscessus subsp. abscessus]|nr:Uncharacterised protein [Mycobacteroides abscessus subsp. abscessus]